MRYKDNPAPPPPGKSPPGDRVMHATVRIGDSELFASDGRCQGQPTFRGMSLTITLTDVKEADRIFAALADGGQIQMPLAQTFFSPRFGMVADRFGVSWMILVSQ